ncbi:aldehyde dehydrogenase family protein [Nocardioides sp. BYT-33-1]|uniref:aldehyde dehydrogenase family protein n=1 Tax=Nocardioides sp. BYT-33-1 TaxID=3416952 RepID=UPI003F52E77C
MSTGTESAPQQERLAEIDLSLHLLIDGELVAGAETMPVVNPATEEVIVDCPRGSVRQFDRAVGAAKVAFRSWSRSPVEARRQVLLRIAEVIDAHAEELAAVLTAEQGKPLADARHEVAGTAAFFRHVAGLEVPSEVVEDSDERRVEIRRRPLGVVAAILPWNAPLLVIAFKVPAALLTGNTVVVKPAATTPLATLLLARLVAGLVPPGVVNVVTDANDLGGVLTSHPDVAKVTFTGSTATGLKVLASASRDLKRVTLELGGNDAAIVLDDADPSTVAAGIFRGAFWNCGQVCLAIKRLYVHDSIYEEVCRELVALAEGTVVGAGVEEGAQMGPLQNRMQFEKVRAFLADAEEHGRVLCGGEVAGRAGYFVAPTVVADIAEGSRLVDEEQFGPILPVLRYATTDEAIRRANASAYGLGASVWSSDLERATEVADQLEAGTVWINKHIDVAPHIPQAGAKHSGLGAELGDVGLLEYTQVQVLNIDK